MVGKLHQRPVGRGRPNGRHQKRVDLGHLALRNLKNGGRTDSSGDDSSSVWASIEGEDSGPRILITLSSEEKSRQLNRNNGRTVNGNRGLRTISVPGICLNGVMQQEPSEYQLIGFLGSSHGVYGDILEGDIGLPERDGSNDRMYGHQSDISSCRSFLDSSRMSADLTDASCFSDNSLDSDY